MIIWLLVPGLLASAVLVQTGAFRTRTCETYDEFTYLRLSIRIFRYNHFECMSSPMCPPLPILLEYWLPALTARALPEGHDWEFEVPALIRRARLLTSVTIGVPLALVVYGWMTRRRGIVAGIVAGGLVALSPSVIASASIATTDACFVLFATVALAALCRYEARPSAFKFLGAGLAWGLALGAKQTAVVLAPAVALVLIMRLPRKKPSATWIDYVLYAVWFIGWRFCVLALLAFTMDSALYAFRAGPAFRIGSDHVGIPVIVPMMTALLPNHEAIMHAVRELGPPLALDTFLGQLEHATSGHSAFLMGRYSAHGWWYFFPVAVALKSTPAELALMALTLLGALMPSSWRDPARRVWLTTFLAMVGVGMLSKLNIGHRYMLLLYPLSILVGSDMVAALADGRAPRARWVGLGLLAWQAVSAVGIAPHYLSYFNSFCGGPREGYRYLADSSLDWGQDLPYLRAELESRGYHKVALNCFGTARAHVYGIRATNWLQADDPDAGCDWLAISATALQGVYGSKVIPYDHFKDLPCIRVGYTIFLYDLSDPRVRAAVAASRAAQSR